jgi:hypothetical protein
LSQSTVKPILEARDKTVLSLYSKVKDIIMNAIVSLSPSVSAIVDELGAIDAEIKRLTKQKEALAAQVKAEGVGRFTGAMRA